VFVAGYVSLLVALFADNLLALILAAAILILGFTLVQRLDPSVKRSCSNSGLVHFLWLGFVGACIYWNASVTIRIIAVLLSPAGFAIVMVAMGLDAGLRKFLSYFVGAYNEIKKRDGSST
jgi:hypothetical protein